VKLDRGDVLERRGCPRRTWWDGVRELYENIWTVLGGCTGPEQLEKESEGVTG